MTPTPTNGARPTFAWIAGVLITIVLLMGGAVIADVRFDLNTVQENQATRNEVQGGVLADIKNMKAQLDRIEGLLIRNLKD